jgi:hypothetical protein
MRRSRYFRATWLVRLLRGWLPDRNPLRRRTDRLETAVFAVLFVLAGAAAPFVGAAGSAWENSTSHREMLVQQTCCGQVQATLLDDAHQMGAYAPMTADADARWTAPDGQAVTGPVQVPADAEAGRVIWIWTNASGQVITPLLPDQIPARDDLAATVAITCLGGVALVAGLAVHGALSRRRLTAWGTDWMVTEPQWNTRRLRHKGRPAPANTVSAPGHFNIG